MRRLKIFFASAVVLMVIGFAVGASQADLLVNRGLPTANLNDPFGNASNASFGATEPQVIGDTFTVGVAGTTYAIDDIRVWVVGEPPAPTTLLGGYVSNGSAGISTISTTIISDTVVTYAGGLPYYDGTYQIHQVDFNVDMLLNGGQSYYFFVQGNDPGTSPFLHATNALLAGSEQDGSDGIFYTYNTLTGDLFPINSALGIWDKVSDINVDVFGQAPEPSVLLLIGCGLVGLAVSRKLGRA